MSVTATVGAAPRQQQPPAARRPIRHGAVVMAILVSIGLTGCTPPTEAPSSNHPSPGVSQTPTPPTIEPSTEPSAGDSVSETPIRIVVDDQIIESRLWDNPAARALLDQLPLTLDFSDFGRQEVTAQPPGPLTMEGMPTGESAPAGTIGYYAPGGVVVLYYTDVGHYSGIVRIGQMDGDYSILQGWSGTRPVTIELAY